MLVVRVGGADPCVCLCTEGGGLHGVCGRVLEWRLHSSPIHLVYFCFDFSSIRTSLERCAGLNDCRRCLLLFAPAHQHACGPTDTNTSSPASPGSFCRIHSSKCSNNKIKYSFIESINEVSEADSTPALILRRPDVAWKAAHTATCTCSHQFQPLVSCQSSRPELPFSLYCSHSTQCQ